MLKHDKLNIIKDDNKNIFHVLSNKIGELGIFFLFENRFVFKPFESEKFLKSWHLATILKELNKLNKRE